MKIKKIQFKNIASYGERLQTVTFPESSNGFYLITGENGSGKSTIGNVIVLSMYGRIGKTGIKKDDISNRINQNGYTYIEFETQSNEVAIERFFNPHKEANIYVDGVNIKDNLPSSKKEREKYIENELLNFPFYLFNSLITLSVNDFKSFVKMSKSDKKMIFDKIFGFGIINEMQELVNTKLKDERSRLDQLNSEIKTTEHNIEKTQEKLNRFFEKVSESNAQKIEELKSKAKELKDQKENYISKVNQLEKEVENKDYEISDIKEKISALKNRIDNNNKQLKLLNNDRCPECESDLNTNYHISKKEELNLSLENDKKRLETLETNLQEIKDTKKEIKSRYSESLNYLNELKSQVKSYIDKIKELKSSSENDENTQNLKDIISSLEQENKEKRNKHKNINYRLNYLKLLNDVLSDGGVKTEMIKSILPHLNNELKINTSLLELPYDIIFNYQFETDVYQMGYAIDVNTLSTGEMKKLDFVCLLSVIKILKYKYPKINTLFLDEIFSSLDSESIKSVLHILYTITNEFDINIMVISHYSLPDDLFTETLEVSKDKGFSEINFKSKKKN
jgi:DNA repair exonuclease SbcCD ATPase subunit